MKIFSLSKFICLGALLLSCSDEYSRFTGPASCQGTFEVSGTQFLFCFDYTPDFYKIYLEKDSEEDCESDDDPTITTVYSNNSYCSDANKVAGKCILTEIETSSNVEIFYYEPGFDLASAESACNASASPGETTVSWEPVILSNFRSQESKILLEDEKDIIKHFFRRER